jgi:hypothetical protein
MWLTVLFVTSAFAATSVYGQLTISEFVADNAGSFLDEDGDDSDWIEIHNPTAGALSTTGLYLTDDSTDLVQWAMPDVIIPAGDYLIVFSSGKDRTNPASELHSNFSLSADGEYLALIDTDGQTPLFAFSPEFPKQFYGVAYGSSGGSTGYLTSPTPGATNTAVEHTDYVRDTSFDVDRGFFESTFPVTVDCATPGATIIVTVDGSTPTLTNGTQSPAPDAQTPPSYTISLRTTTMLRAAAFKTGLRPSNVDTQSYFILDRILDQPVQPRGYPLPWITRSGAAIGGDYEMDPDVVGSVYSREELKAALLDIPTISIVTEIDNLFGQQNGIQVNPTDSGEASERRVSVEMIGFEDGTPMQLDAGMRMNGNASRDTSRPKHNFRLTFRNEYGSGRLNFPLFGADGPTDRFNQIVLRGGNGNSWIHPNAGVYSNAMYIRDQWFRDAHAAMGYPEVQQREVHVYFNGLYWGIHHLFERIEEKWASERFGGEDDDWEGFRIVGGNNIEVIQGTPAEVSARMLDSWQTILDAAAAGDLTTVEQYLDLDSFMDYIILNFHAGNADWDQNNVRAMRRRNPSGKFMFFCHDSERAGLNGGGQGINLDVSTKNTLRGPTSIHTFLRSHATYYTRFADRAYKHMFNGGALTPENGAAQWAARADGIREALKAESARWGNFRREPAHNLVDWEASLQREYTDWFPFRTPVTISQLRATGVYPTTDPPTLSQHGGYVPAGFELEVTNPGGTVYYTIDGTDPRTARGRISSLAQVLPEDGIIIINNTTLPLMVRRIDNSEWSPLIDVTFITAVPASSSNLAISEIYYNPPGDSEATEFVELINISNDPISLSEVQFSDGIEFTFDDLTILGPGERILVVSDLDAFEASFGTGLPIAGSYTGQLKNSGEILTLIGPAPTIIASIHYLEGAPWSLAADGSGSSLTLIAPEAGLDSSDPVNWRASADDGGTPGGTDATSFAGSTEQELFAYSFDGDGAIEASVQLLEVGGTAQDYLVITAETNLVADDVVFDIQLSPDLENWTSGTAVFLGSLDPNAPGTRSWRAPIPTSGVETPRYCRIEVSLR